MSLWRTTLTTGAALAALATASALPASSAMAQTQPSKPNIVFIMGDDIGWMQPSIYHEGLMVGETPNIDRIGHEGMKFMDYYAMQSCTSGRNAFVTGMYPLRTGLIPPQLPGSPTALLPGTPSIGKFLLDLGYTTGEFGKNHLGDKDFSLPTAHGFQEYWGYLYHLDAMQGVSFPDLYANDSTEDQVAASGAAPHAPTRRSKACPRSPAWLIPRATWCASRRPDRCCGATRPTARWRARIARTKAR